MRALKAEGVLAFVDQHVLSKYIVKSLDSTLLYSKVSLFQALLKRTVCFDAKSAKIRGSWITTLRKNGTITSISWAMVLVAVSP